MKTRTKKPATKSASKPTKPNNRMLVRDGDSCLYKLRISQRNGARDRFARTLVRCGCCDESVEIYHDHEVVEINGVIASPREWQRLLAPILRGKRD